MQDFIYTLDSEPESDTELEGAALDELDASKTAGPSTATASSPLIRKGSERAKKSSKSSSGTNTRIAGPSRPRDIDEDDALAPTIDPTFNFDLGGGRGSFFDGLGVDELGIDADEVKIGTNPVCVQLQYTHANSQAVSNNGTDLRHPLSSCFP